MKNVILFLPTLGLSSSSATKWLKDCKSLFLGTNLFLLARSSSSILSVVKFIVHRSFKDLHWDIVKIFSILKCKPRIIKIFQSYYVRWRDDLGFFVVKILQIRVWLFGLKCEKNQMVSPKFHSLPSFSKWSISGDYCRIRSISNLTPWFVNE